MIISEERLWKNAELFVRSYVDKKHVSTLIGKFAATAEIVTDHKLPIPVKRFKRQVAETSISAEAEIKAYSTILTTSAIVASMITFVCLIIMLHIFIYMRWGITRQLILLNAKLGGMQQNEISAFPRKFLDFDKVCALESRLGTRQLSEELQRKLCEEIGVTYGTVQNERQKFAQEVVNDERKMAEDVVKAENEPQYETMCGIGDEVFTTKKGNIFIVSEILKKNGSKPGTTIEKSAEENHYENVPKAPTVGGMVEEADPQYQTLVGMHNEKIFPEKKKGAENTNN
ncbi:unnamed protein product [Onchocerca flexuosa]|uniref:Uncharacterized protein n=1 Tax=Onchocerca flexuosa TaxID=387005 RepID=A0A183HZC6_9BILA|nr:unnamed protein product [Onchocerca flexuosa]